MITIFNISLLLTFITIGVSSDFTLKGDPCSKSDNCNSKAPSKTCSCESDCHVYGTCCQDKDKNKQDHTDFRCYSRRTTSPVFAIRSCPEDFRGHVGTKRGCLEDDEDEMDVRNNLLVTSRTTKKTYWNKLCAACNSESASDLEFWNIVVSCPSHEEVDRYLIRSNLTFDQDKLQWGVVIGDAFLRCVVKYSPPSYIDEVKHCTPNITADCPVGYENEAVATKCSQYYAERKLKNSDTVFRNIHCAICNGADVTELECPGMSGPEDNAEEGDFGETVEEVFTHGRWLEKASGKQFECSRGHSYDPFRMKCRREEIQEEVAVIPNSAHTFRRDSLAVLMLLVIWSLKVGVFAQLPACQQTF